ncbi:MAG TPA: serine/threonine-protein kinase, partial [Enhygromyxa sp.]|nr:serine/threonine-protein kinase [Enhygromyxa sp.]
MIPTADQLELREEIGVGAVATVVRALDRSTGHAYAVKLLHERNARDPTAARRFAREVELARTLRAFNIVAVHGALELNGRRALLMELIEGPTLAELIARAAPLEPTRLLRLARDIARGLAVAHAGGVIHRDLKPANVLIAHANTEQEIAKIADFGMARATSFAGVDREAMTVLGTPDYMAPETLDPLAVDPRTDLYALGCIMLEMATGRPPFAAPTPFAVLDAHRTRVAPTMPDRYGPELRELVSGLLAKQPSDRIHAASAVVEVLDGLIADVPNATRALALVRPRDLLDAAVSGRCARCGAPIVVGVRVCLECGLWRVAVEPGRWSVFVTGPGELGDKLSSTLRDRLLTWLRANPDSGLGVGTLAERIPRLPFPIVVRISEASARALAASLASLGILAEARPGGRLAHGGMLEKVFRISVRRSKVALPLLLLMLPLALILFVVLLPLLPVYLGAVAWWISRPSLTAEYGRRLALPPGVDEHLRAVEQKVPRLGPRHRPELRAVVMRVLALLEATPESQRGEIDAEMAHALNVATVATERMDELDAIVSRPDFDAGEPEQRKNLQERDMWAARMLELTATLDALVARQTAARQSTRAVELEQCSELDE